MVFVPKLWLIFGYSKNFVYCWQLHAVGRKRVRCLIKRKNLLQFRGEFRGDSALFAALVGRISGQMLIFLKNINKPNN